MISTRNLSELPDIDTLKRLFQSLAMLDAILSLEWQYRYYSFNAEWDVNEALGSMRNGCGNHLFALFTCAGCFLKGFNHESVISSFQVNPPTLFLGVLDTVPTEFKSCLK